MRARRAFFYARNRFPSAAVVAALAAGLSCKADLKTGPDYGPVSIEIIQGNDQSATVATAVAIPPSIKILNELGAPVVNVIVAFAVTSGGGTITSDSFTTGSDGIASLESWTLGTTAGLNTVSATATGLENHPVTLTAHGLAGPAATLSVATPPPPTVSNSLVFPQQPVLQVSDTYGNAVAVSGTPVTATLLEVGGTLQGTMTVPSDASGAAHFTNLAIVGVTGAYTLAFNGPLLPTVTTPLQLIAGIPSRLDIVAQPSSTGRIGVALAQQPVVEIEDVSGNRVLQSGIVVTASVASGGGNLSGTPSVPSDATGLERYTDLAFIGPVGVRSLKFSAPGMTSVISNPITLTAGPAALLVKTAGDNQLAGVSTILPIDPVTSVTDRSGNPIAGVNVSFVISGGGGTIAKASATTNAQGLASGGHWTLGPNPGTNLLTATSTGLSGSPAVFTATGSSNIGPPASLTKISGDGQTAVAGSPLPESLVVEVRDAQGHGVPGIPTTWTVLSSGGSVFPASAVTDLNGRLAARWILSGVAGSNLVQVNAAGFQVGFTATGVPGSANRLGLLAAPSSARSGIPFPTQPSLQLQDVNGNPVSQSGVVVTAVIASGGGNLGGTVTATTNAQGRATFTDLMIIGLVGSRTLRFTAAGLTPATTAPFQLSAGGAATLVLNGGDGQSGLVGVPVAVNPSVRVNDGAGNPVAGVAVGFTVLTGGGSIAIANATTNSQGIASGGAWTLGPVEGPNSLQASSAGLSGSPVVFNATGVASAGTPAALLIVSGASQSGTAGAVLAESLVVRVVDANGIGVAGVSVGWTASGGGSLSPPTMLSNVSGLAAAEWTLGPVAGNNGATATAAGFVASFTATGVAGPAARLAITTQPTTAVSGLPLNPQPALVLQDANGNPVFQSGVAVTAAIASGGGTLGGTLTATTATNGVASFTNLVIAGLVGTRTLRFTAPGLTAVTSGPIALSAGNAAQIAKQAGDGQSGPVATPLAIDPQVLVTDASGNPVSGIGVTFTVLTGGGNVANPTAVSNSQGIATPGHWTLGPSVGSNTLRAASTGLTGSPLTFTATAVPGTPSSLVKVSGDGQSGLGGIVLPESLVVRVLDNRSNGVPGVTVNWSVLVGGGFLSPGQVATDGNGQAAAALTLGVVAGPVTVQAQVASLTITFSATILPGGGGTMHPVFSTYLGGNLEDQVRDIAVDGAGNIYVTGGTQSANFLTTSGAFDRSQNGNYDVYVTKLNPSGQVIWSTFLGGPNYDRAYAIEVDAQGFVYVAGRAGDQFPVTAGVFQASFKGSPDVPPYGPQDGFVCKLRPQGNALVWCSYFGTDDNKMIRDLDLDAQGNIYLASSSESGSFPAGWLSGSYQTQRAGMIDGVVAKVSNNGSQVIWASYIGGSQDEAEEPSLRVDNAGNVFVLYSTQSNDAPTPNGFDHSLKGISDLYLVKFSNDGSQLLFGTYLGGSNPEDVETHELALDPQGNPVVGSTSGSSDYPTTAGTLQPLPPGSGDGVITRIAANGSQILASTYLGGVLPDKTEGISIDAQGNVYVTGNTGTPGLSFLAGGFQPNLNGIEKDLWLVKLSPDLSQVLYGTYLGGTLEDLGRAGVATPAGDYIFGGNITSDDFPTVNPLQSSFMGGILEGAVAKFSPGP